MKVADVLLQALKEHQPWIHVAEVLGVSARTVHRLRWRYEHYGFDGLFDHRRRRPPPRRPLGERVVLSERRVQAPPRGRLHGAPGRRGATSFKPDRQTSAGHTETFQRAKMINPGLSLVLTVICPLQGDVSSTRSTSP